MTDRFVASLAYDFSTNTAEPPTSNQVRLDASDYASVTRAWFRLLDASGIDQYAFLTTLPVGTRLYLQDKNDHLTFVQLRTTGAPVDKSSYIELPVLFLAGGQPLASQAMQAAFFAPVPDVPVPPQPDPGGGTFVRAPWASPVSVSSVLIAGPTEEPITLAQAKLAAGLDWPAGDPRDAQMQAFIQAARQQVELDTGLALLTQTRDVTITGPVDGYSTVVPMPQQAMPVQAISGPMVLALDSAVRQSSTGWWFAAPTGTWRIVAGWPDAQTLQAQAPLLVQAVTLLTAHFATMGRDLVFAGTALDLMPMGYAEAIAPYRLVVLA